MPSATIAIASEDEVRAGTLGRLLREFNYERVGRYPEGQSVYLNAKDERGELLAGFRGEVSFHWLFVNVLFVDERERGRAWARACLPRAKLPRRARARCMRAWKHSNGRRLAST
jgi:hypothetical protein